MISAFLLCADASVADAASKLTRSVLFVIVAPLFGYTERSSYAP